MPIDSSCLFCIVGRNDNLIYLSDLSGAKKESGPTHLSQFILHSALDFVDEQVWRNPSMYLKIVDKFGNANVSVFVVAGNVKFMLLHEKKDDDGVKNFFQEVYELYLKVLLNPFYTFNTPITMPLFDEKVKAVAKKKLDKDFFVSQS